MGRLVKGNWTGIGAWMLCWVAFGEEPVELSPYVVEAWHFDQVGTRIPAEVIRVGSAEIRESGVASVPAVLEQLAGVRLRSLTGNGTEGQLALRGFGDNSGLRILVLVDGQVFNPPDMSGINWTGISLDEVESVEVIRGGQGVLYGNHAVSGVVKLKTRNPSEELSGSLMGDAGSNEAWAVSGRLEGQFNGVGLRGGMYHRQTDGYRENAASEAQSASLTWQIVEPGNHDWRGRFQWSEQETQFPGPLLYSQYRDNPRQSTNAGEDLSIRETYQATLHGEGEAAFGKWEFGGGFLGRDTEWSLDGLAGENEHDRLSAAPRLKTNFRNGFFITGIDYHDDRMKTRQFLDSADAPVKAFGTLARQTAGLYFLGGQDIGDQVSLTAGFRREMARTDTDYLHYKTDQLLEFIETNRGTVPNPNFRDPPEADPELSFSGLVEKSGWAAEVSITYELSTDLVFWSGWDRVYRYPSVDETAAFQGFPLANPLNTALDPETGNNVEIGLKRIGRNWQVSGTLFWMRLDDEIVYDEDARLNRNIGTTDRKGIELAGSYNGENWGLSGNMSWIRAEFDDRNLDFDGSRVPLVPDYQAGLSIWHSLPADLRIRAHFQAFGEQVQGNDFENDRRRIDAYGLVSLYLRWKPVTALTIGAGIENLLDRVHAISAYNGGFYPGGGRHVRMTLAYEY